MNCYDLKKFASVEEYRPMIVSPLIRNGLNNDVIEPLVLEKV
jgi:hypothetical protein